MNDLLINQESEQAAIGMLMRSDMCDYAQAEYGIKPEMFGYQIHQTIVKEIYRVNMENSGLLDPILLQGRLRSLGVLSELPSPMYLMDCVGKAPVDHHAPMYFSEIKELHERRLACKLAQTIMDEATKDVSERNYLARVPGKFYEIMPESTETRTPAKCLDELHEKWVKLKSGELKISGISTGYHEYDAMLGGGYKPGLHVIAARTSCGKTSLEGCIANNMLQAGIPVGRVCMDMEMSQLVARDASRLARVPFTRLETGKVSDEELDRVKEKIEEIKKWPMYVIESTFDISPIYAWAKLMHRKHGIKALTVDFIQLCKAKHIKSTNKTDIIEEASALLKQISKELHIPVIMLAQLNRESDKGERAPRLSDIKQCGAIEEHAATVTLLSQSTMDMTGHPINPEIQRAIEFNVAKNQQGGIGMREVWFFTPIFNMEFAPPNWGLR